MPRTMPIIEARKKLTSFPEVFAQEPELGAVAVDSAGKAGIGHHALGAL